MCGACGQPSEAAINSPEKDWNHRRTRPPSSSNLSKRGQILEDNVGTFEAAASSLILSPKLLLAGVAGYARTFHSR